MRVDRSVLIVAATHRAAQIRDHFHGLGCRLRESRWDGPSPGLCFELPSDVTAAPPAFLASVVARIPFELPTELGERVVGSLSGLGERLSGALRLDVMGVHRSVDPPAEVVVVWIAGAVAQLDVRTPTDRWAWTASPEPRGTWRDQVERFLGTRPLTQAPGQPGGAGVVRTNPWAGQAADRIGARWVMMGWLLAVILLAEAGKAAGDLVGHGNVGGTVGFFLGPAAFLVLGAKTGILRRPSAGVGRVFVLAAAGGLLMAMARVLAGTSAAAGFGTAGLALVAVAVVWGASKFFAPPRKADDDWLPDE